MSRGRSYIIHPWGWLKEGVGQKILPRKNYHQCSAKRAERSVCLVLSILHLHLSFSHALQPPSSYPPPSPTLSRDAWNSRKAVEYHLPDLTLYCSPYCKLWNLRLNDFRMFDRNLKDLGFYDRNFVQCRNSV